MDKEALKELLMGYWFQWIPSSLSNSGKHEIVVRVTLVLEIRLIDPPYDMGTPKPVVAEHIAWMLLNGDSIFSK